MGKTLDKKCLPRSLRGGSGGLRAKVGRRAATKHGENETERERLSGRGVRAVFAAGKRPAERRKALQMVLARQIEEARWMERTRGLSAGGILRVGCRVVESGGVLEDAA